MFFFSHFLNFLQALFYDEFKLDIGEEEFNNFYDSFDINHDENVNI